MSVFLMTTVATAGPMFSLISALHVARIHSSRSTATASLSM